MTGLTDGTSYTFTVVAANANGTSQPSPPSNAVTPTAPPAPANDLIANAQVISGDSGSVNGTNVGATLETDEPEPFGNVGGSSVWYVWTPTNGGGSVTFAACGATFASSIAIYQQADPNAPVAVTNLSENTPGYPSVFCPDGSRPRGVEIDINQSGGTYFVQVDGANTSGPTPTGTFSLTWPRGPAVAERGNVSGRHRRLAPWVQTAAVIGGARGRGNGVCERLASVSAGRNRTGRRGDSSAVTPGCISSTSGCGGGGGAGCASFAASGATDVSYLSGGAPAGNGSVVVVPLRLSGEAG